MTTKEYKDIYPDVEISGIEPDLHYEKIGKKLNRIHNSLRSIKLDARDIIITEYERIYDSIIFDWKWYNDTFHGGHYRSKLEAFNAYIKNEGGIEKPHLLFDNDYYKSQLPENERNENLLIHYIEKGFSKYDPNKYFSTKYYISKYSDSIKEKTPFEHFLEQSHPYNYNPSPIFNNKQYLINNPDVDEARIQPLLHFITTKYNEFRSRSRYYEEVINSRIEKHFQISEDDICILYVAYTSDSKLSNFHKRDLETYAKIGLKVILIINTDDYNNYVRPPLEIVDGCIIRDNVGYDFAAWSCASLIFSGLYRAKKIILTNDSVAIINEKSITTTLHALLKSKYDISFLTKNFEIKEHAQSYFLSLNNPQSIKISLDYLKTQEISINKENLIYEQEINLESNLKDLGLSTNILFDKKSLYANLNPTIHYWEELINEGFPFFKIQLITKRLVNRDSISKYMLSDDLDILYNHTKIRNIDVSCNYPNVVTHIPPIQSIQDCTRIGSIGQLQAYNPSENDITTVQIPLNEIEDYNYDSKIKILIVIHCFYVNISINILDKLIPISKAFKVHVICTTCSLVNKNILEEWINEKNYLWEVLLTENRGRDIGPFLVRGLNEINEYEIIMHLHTKKSPYGLDYDEWGDYLINSMIGSVDIFKSNILIISNENVGFIYPDHHKCVENLRNWGFDFSNAKKIFTKIGGSLNSNFLLEFPTGSMFIAKSNVIKEFTKLNLSFDDFPEEASQQDGTLAHSIERIFLYVCESVNLQYLKVSISKTNYSVTTNPASIDYLIKTKRSITLLESYGFPSSKSNYETFPINITRSTSKNLRLNLIIPTIRPEYTYGGISTALKYAAKQYKSLNAKCSNITLRVLVTSDQVELSHNTVIEKYFGFSAPVVNPSNDNDFNCIVPLFHYRNTPLSLRTHDIYFSTAWWTSDLAIRLIKKQETFFRRSYPNIYFIQDYEPGFYAWSKQSILAKSTYLYRNQFAIYNSEELANFMSDKYSFENSFYIPFELNDALKTQSFPTKDKTIFVYARPSVSRNLFDITVEALALWQGCNPDVNLKYEIVFAGEEFDSLLVSHIENCQVGGKLSLQEYKDLLSRCSIGLSLMESPHPSYPPLELASFSCIAITNSYESKNLSRRSSRIISVDDPVPNKIKEALDYATSLVITEQLKSDNSISRIETNMLEFDPEIVAEQITRMYTN
jgi:lipopolysaccharide biosynthesis protein